MAKRSIEEKEKYINRIKKSVEDLNDPDKRRKRREEDEKTNFVRRAKTAGFSVSQALFLYENVSLPGHGHLTLSRIGGSI